MSYLIINNECLAYTKETLKSGEEIRISWLKTENDLVNAVYAKVSNAKKWRYENSANADVAVLFDATGIYKDFYAGSGERK
jgi:hypothetical protein